MLSDYVAGSSGTFIKDPNYWGRTRSSAESITVPGRYEMVDNARYRKSNAAILTAKIDWIVVPE